MKKERGRLLIIGGVLLLLIFLSFYVNLFLGFDTVYTHFYYVFIIIIGIWFQEYIVHSAILLGILHIAINYSINSTFLFNSILRTIILVIVALLFYRSRNGVENYREILERTVKDASDGVVLINKDKKIININNSAENILGKPLDQLIGKDIYEVINFCFQGNEDEFNQSIECFNNYKKNNLISNFVGCGYINGKDNRKILIEYTVSPLFGKNNNFMGEIIIFRDNTEKYHREKKNEYICYRDYLTGLYNRRYLEEVFDFDNEDHLPLSIIMGDLNNLKLINDTYGYAVGDEVLKSASNIMQEFCNNGEVVSRWGGDEFVLMLPKTNEEKVEMISNKL